MNDLLIKDAIVIPLVGTKVSGSSNRLAVLDITPWDADTWNNKDWHRK